MKTDKDRIRHRVWETLKREKAGRFPFPLTHRIPNFKGAEKAASYIASMPEYQSARTVKVNPDSPQLPLRERVLKDGKMLLVPTPRLKAGFIQVDPSLVPPGEERRAASLSHIHAYGRECPLHELPTINLIVVGSVAVHRDGRRLGKGEGYADREYAVLREIGQPEIPVVTTVHDLQLVDEEIPVEAFDLTVDWIATPQGLMRTNGHYPKPTGIHWEEVTEEERREMPVLGELWERLRHER